MFICDDCLIANYKNSPSSLRSNGVCEVCNKPKDCSDLNSKYLTLKNPPAPQVEEGTAIHRKQARQAALEGYEKESLIAYILQFEFNELPIAQPVILGTFPMDKQEVEKLLHELAHIRGIVLDLFTHEHPFYNDWLEPTVTDPYQISEMLKAFFVWNNLEFIKRLNNIQQEHSTQYSKLLKDFNEVNSVSEKLGVTVAELERENSALTTTVTEYREGCATIKQELELLTTELNRIKGTT